MEDMSIRYAARHPRIVNILEVDRRKPKFSYLKTEGGFDVCRGSQSEIRAAQLELQKYIKSFVYPVENNKVAI